MRRSLAVLFGLLLALALAGVAQRAGDGRAARVPSLLEDSALVAALAGVEAAEPVLLDEQVALTEIPAPPFEERARAEHMKRKFEELGLRRVRIDAAGNVLGERPGLAPRPNLVLAAHLDTVFPAGTEVGVKREGQVLRAPGIADDGRGLAVLLGVARALDRGKVQTPGTITFVADVGEEGLGDLRGVKHLFGEELKGKVDAFVSVDGTGHGITHVAVGSHRYRVTFRGPGGHSFGAFGLVNPVHALGRAVARIADLEVPQAPKVTFNVGRIGGGTSVNSIAHEAWFEIDLRSSDAAALGSIDASFQEAVDRAAREENERWGSGRLEVVRERVGQRPAGRTPEDAPIVQAAVAVNRALGLPVSLGEGSTDANIPISLGIPAITVGGGGRATGAHSLGEAFDTTDSWKGTARVTALAFVLAR
ncbi:MAG TPA: M20/M25/M40 family metallo-hydrolase [Vicinamibacterales bacterium]|nr:M20/M25/M40 family metallo-hydrolase [Vicinamibacterales bacterium]